MRQLMIAFFCFSVFELSALDEIDGGVPLFIKEVAFSMTYLAEPSIPEIGIARSKPLLSKEMYSLPNPKISLKPLVAKKEIVPVPKIEPKTVPVIAKTEPKKTEIKTDTKTEVKKSEAKTQVVAITQNTGKSTNTKINTTSPAIKVPYENIDPVEIVSKVKPDALALPNKVIQSTASLEKPTIRSAMTAQLLTNFDILFPGSGWLYLGTGLQNDGLSLIGNAITAESTKFTLKSTQEGNRVLKFQRQDGQTGGIDSREIVVTVSKDKQSTQSYEVPGLTLGPNVALPKVEEPAILEIPKDADGQFSLALKQEKNNMAFAIGLYQRILKDSPSFGKNDEVYFRYASLLEGAGDASKYREAFNYYVKITKDYPYSALSEEARKRARNLDRTFLNPR